MIKISKDFIEIENMVIINKNLDERDCIGALPTCSKTIRILNNDFIILNNKKLIDRLKIKLKIIIKIIKIKRGFITLFLFPFTPINAAI